MNISTAERKLILTVGLPGSGKTTWAQEVSSQYPDKVVRLNKDDIGERMFGKGFHSAHTKRRMQLINSEQQMLLKKHLTEGKVVILDDTHTRMRSVQMLVQLANSHGASVEAQYFDISVEECLSRNAKRDRNVPEEVIRKMAVKSYGYDGKNLRKYLFGANGTVGYDYDPTHPDEQAVQAFNETIANNGHKSMDAIIFDMDGTLVDVRGLSDTFMPGPEKDYDSFHNESEFAPANEDVWYMAQEAHELGFSVLIVTARTANYAAPTINWLKNNEVPVDKLYMRPRDDWRVDVDTKKTIDSWIVQDGYRIVHAVDDNPEVVQYRRSTGIWVTQVPYHYPVQPVEHITYGKISVESPFNSGFCLKCAGPVSTGNLCSKCSPCGSYVSLCQEGVQCHHRQVPSPTP